MNVRRSVAFELAAIGAAALVFVATFQVRPPYVDFALAAAAVVLLVLSARRSSALWEVRTNLSARSDDRRGAWLATAAFTAAALTALAVVAALVRGDAASREPAPATWHLLIAVALYFPWALMQQYLFQRYLLARLLHLTPPPVAIALTAVAFSCVHFPRWPVMAVVLVAGVVWSSLYVRYRRLLPLAASHALLGAALHYWVFGRDLFAVWLPAWAT